MPPTPHHTHFAGRNIITEVFIKGKISSRKTKSTHTHKHTQSALLLVSQLYYWSVCYGQGYWWWDRPGRWDTWSAGPGTQTSRCSWDTCGRTWPSAGSSRSGPRWRSRLLPPRGLAPPPFLPVTTHTLSADTVTVHTAWKMLHTQKSAWHVQS